MVCYVLSKFLCSVEDVHNSGTEHDWKLKFSMHTHLTHINSIFECFHASVILHNVDILH